MFTQKTFGFCFFLSFIASTHVASAESIEVDVIVKTAHVNNAGTSNKVFFSLLHQTGGRRSRIEKTTVELNNRKRRDFSTGRESRFTVKLDCPVSKIRGFALSVGDSDNAWACSGIAFQIVKDDKRSQPFVMALPKAQRWFSAAANDGGKKSPAAQYRWWSIRRPKLSVKQRAM